VRESVGGSLTNTRTNLHLHANLNVRDPRVAQTAIADGALGTDEFSVGLDALGRVRISPTDVSQFIRFDQCERYLRLRLLGPGSFRAPGFA
jgi:hypothetical protein